MKTPEETQCNTESSHDTSTPTEGSLIWVLVHTLPVHGLYTQSCNNSLCGLANIFTEFLWNAELLFHVCYSCVWPLLHLWLLCWLCPLRNICILCALTPSLLQDTVLDLFNSLNLQHMKSKPSPPPESLLLHPDQNGENIHWISTQKH